MPLVNLFGPIDQVLGGEVGVGEVLVIEVVLLVGILANFVTRRLAYGKHKRQAEDGADAVARYLPHEVLNVLLVLATFYYLTVAHQAGIVMSMFVVGLFITDFFEFEARKVEARRDIPLEMPKGAMVAAVFALSYAAYQVFFTFLEGPLSSIA